MHTHNSILLCKTVLHSITVLTGFIIIKPVRDGYAMKFSLLVISSLFEHFLIYPIYYSKLKSILLCFVQSSSSSIIWMYKIFIVNNYLFHSKTSYWNVAKFLARSCRIIIQTKFFGYSLNSLGFNQ